MENLVFKKEKKNWGGNNYFFNQVAWLTQAVSKDETRYNLGVIHVEDHGCMLLGIASDGHRVHVADVTCILQPGNYTVESRSKTCIVLSRYEETVHFPNWQRIFEPINGNHTHLTTVHSGETGLKAVGTSLCRIARAMPSAFGLDISYLSDVFTFEALGRWEAYVEKEPKRTKKFSYYAGGKEQDTGDPEPGPVYFMDSEGSRLAAIMPIRI